MNYKGIGIEIFTDGGCRGVIGACAFIILLGRKVIYKDVYINRNTTNNRMELGAVIGALKYINLSPELQKANFYINTDSQYVQKGITQWITKWEKMDGKLLIENQSRIKTYGFYLRMK